MVSVVPVIGAAERTLVGTLLGGLVVLGLVIGLPLLWPSLVARVTARLAVRCAGGSALVARGVRAATGAPAMEMTVVSPPAARRT